MLNEQRRTEVGIPVGQLTWETEEDHRDYQNWLDTIHPVGGGISLYLKTAHASLVADALQGRVHRDEDSNRRHLMHAVVNGMRYHDLDTKWQVESEELIDVIEGFGEFDAGILIDKVNRFWESEPHKDVEFALAEAGLIAPIDWEMRILDAMHARDHADDDGERMAADAELKRAVAHSFGTYLTANELVEAIDWQSIIIGIEEEFSESPSTKIAEMVERIAEKVAEQVKSF